jgi:hypothetical protein
MKEASPILAGIGRGGDRRRSMGLLAPARGLYVKAGWNERAPPGKRGHREADVLPSTHLLPLKGMSPASAWAVAGVPAARNPGSLLRRDHARFLSPLGTCSPRGIPVRGLAAHAMPWTGCHVPQSQQSLSSDCRVPVRIPHSGSPLPFLASDGRREATRVGVTGAWSGD